MQQELPFDASRRCGSCGGPAVDDELCQNCRDAFSSVLGHAASTSEPPDLYAQIEATGEPAPWVDTHFAATQFDVVETPSVAETDFAHAFESDAPIAVASVETFSPVETPAPVEAPASFETRAAVETPAAVAAPAVAVKSVAAAAPAPAAKAKPAPAAASRRRNLRPEMVAVAAVGIVAVVGVPMGAKWLRERTEPPKVTVVAPPPAHVSAPAHEARTSRRAAEAAPSETTDTAVAPSTERTPAPEVRAAATPRPSRAPAPRAELPPAASRPDVPALDYSPMAVAALAPQAPPPAPEPQAFVTAEAPAGKLFDVSEVDETPRIATRVEPQLPGTLAGRAVNDVVVVRILVSQTGHPFRVNLLRRSRLGASVDDSVVAAVKQWTFTPARKRGDAVSCWFNFGVSIAN